MAGRVAGKKAFITGGAQGLGAAIARKLAAEGAVVSIADINYAGAQAVAAEIVAEHGEGAAFAFPLDVTREDQWIYALEEADAAMGGISVLVNNAGISRGGNIEQLSFEDWKLVMSVNVDSVFLGTKHALKYMRQNQPGSIVNISSIAGLIAAHNSPVYNASKAGVWLLSKGIALHCAKQGLEIRSNSVHPTFIDTPILDPIRQQLGKDVAEGKLARQIPLGHIGEPDDVANAVLYLASDESKFMTGAELKLDGGISAM
ncbi:NAD(P)-dependent dehydrogenase (short-subunit alcohol dehydrogenase family) [Phenylobacterium haematophilum]|jgi:NAD(P)-dependent dehydrogenase (short-subunit alcohol dehydrogenase family)|uniref:D-xylose 1-dehydrogenase n=1 Tax=Phenylobacterium haematophilum TaxID=98513 RepID=A0A839ZY41_9CAUL|nr:SDR family oxidoreductase [Phenylobacterium haematophilum]MBB3890649.1 NAD(P)-dependent dehydrogenase (short-subunit alcohol dehydrogenase family) [Phenylobacterium haematophilum]